MAKPLPADVAAVQEALDECEYIADRSLAVAIHLALQLGRPLFLEGEAGVGKTEVAKVLAEFLEAPLIRLQCYEGLDAGHALYEWDYARQMLAIRLLEARGEGHAADVKDIMSRDYLVARPLLKAVELAALGQRPVLLIDEIDRADEEFEAYLLELLSDFQVTIPEVGTIAAEEPPVVILTSNRTREIHDALKRRCIYYWIDYPNFEREVAIVGRKVPGISDVLASELARVMERLREMDLFKPPGVAETLDWAQALTVLDATRLTPEVIEQTVGVALKYREDIERVRASGLEALLAG
ncbi:MAG TPA: MoxR family ATPase [Acidimicrobiia bacterium]|jgi:MoxR-like ATPase|nr:MoxR family ATPase [Acidimicrobiia bacterium]